MNITSKLFHLDVSFPENNILVKGDKTYYYQNADDNETTIAADDLIINNAQGHVKSKNLKTTDAYITKIGEATILRNDCGFFAPLQDALKRTYTEGTLWTTPVSLLALCAIPYVPGYLRNAHERFIEEQKEWVGHYVTEVISTGGFESSRNTYLYTEQNLAWDRITSIIYYVAVGVLLVLMAVSCVATDSLVRNFYNNKLHMRQWKVVELKNELTTTAQAFFTSIKEKTTQELQGNPTNILHPTDQRCLSSKEKEILKNLFANKFNESSGEFEDPIDSKPIENLWSIKTLRLGKYIIPLHSAINVMDPNRRQDNPAQRILENVNIQRLLKTARTLETTEREEFLSTLSALSNIPEEKIRTFWS